MPDRHRNPRLDQLWSYSAVITGDGIGSHVDLVFQDRRANFTGGLVAGDVFVWDLQGIEK